MALVHKFFAIRVVETWNRLPDSVKLTEKPESFKKELNGRRNVRKLERQLSARYTES